MTSPLLLPQGPLQQIIDLQNFTLLHDQDPSAQWRPWLQSRAAGDFDCSRGPRYASADLLLQAAIDGQGIALVPGFLASTDIREGRLLQALPDHAQNDTALWLVMPEANRHQASVLAFQLWLQQQFDTIE